MHKEVIISGCLTLLLLVGVPEVFLAIVLGILAIAATFIVWFILFWVVTLITLRVEDWWHGRFSDRDWETIKVTLGSPR